LVYVDQEDPGRIVRYWKSCAYRPGRFENMAGFRHTRHFLYDARYIKNWGDLTWICCLPQIWN